MSISFQFKFIPILYRGPILCYERSPVNALVLTGFEAFSYLKRVHNIVVMRLTTQIMAPTEVSALKMHVVTLR